MEVEEGGTALWALAAPHSGQDTPLRPPSFKLLKIVSFSPPKIAKIARPPTTLT